MSQLSVVLYAVAVAVGRVQIVFSSPAAKNRSGRPGRVVSLRLELSHTPWWRWMTSTGGTVPSAHVGCSGAMRDDPAVDLGLRDLAAAGTRCCSGPA